MRRTFLVILPLMGVACSLTNLDGFTGGPHPTPDGGANNEASTKPIDASRDANPAATEAGTPSEGGTPSTDPYGDAVRADAPTSWWRFEDPVGSSTLHDEMKQHDGHVQARDSNPITIQWGVPGVIGKAVQLGNTAGYFNIGDVFDFAGSAAFTLEAWGQNDALAEEYEGMFNKRTDANGDADTGWVVFVHKGDQELGFQFWKNATVTAGVSGTLASGFHHVVVTATTSDDGVEYVLFLDGIPVGNDPKKTVQELDTTANLLLGYGWSGALDEIAIYEHALTPERVSAHYKAARP